MSSNPRDYGLPFPELRPGQGEMIEALLAKEDWTTTILQAPTGCHIAGQPIMLCDGRVIPVEEIRLHDKLMGTDGEPRTVISLIRGFGKMYRIIPTRGKPFVVNEDHILTLVRTQEFCEQFNHSKRRWNYGGLIVDVSVSEWINWSKSKKHLHKLFRVPIDFQELKGNELPLDPYLLGLFIGDGCLIKGATITNIDPEIIDYMDRWADNYGLKLKSHKLSHRMSTRVGHKDTNPVVEKLKELGLFGKTSGYKFIPQVYKVANKESRLAILAGLMDTDGHLSKSTVFDYISKSQQLAEDVAFISRSLGLSAIISQCEKRCQTGGGGIYYRVCISGNVKIIPCKLKRKQAPQERTQKKNPLRTGFSIEYAGEDNYYGFVIDGDGRYLLDDFTVTHNSGKSSLAYACGHKTSVTSLVKTKSLQSSVYGGLGFDILYGRGNYPCIHPDRGDPLMNADQCMYESKMTECEYAGECSYLIRKSQVQRSRVRSLNYAYFLSARWPREEKRVTKYLFIDEAHLLSDETVEWVGLTVRDIDRLRYGLPEFPSCYQSSRENTLAVLGWMERTVGVLQVKAKELNGKHPDTLAKKSKIDRLAEKVETTCLAIHRAEADWYVRSGVRALEYMGQAKPGLVAKPLTARHHFPKMFIGIYPRVVMMSATIGAPEFFAEELGLTRWHYDSVPNQWGPETRPIHILPCPTIGYKSPESSYVKQAELIRDALQSLPDDWSGIIHVTSWKQAQDLSGRLARGGFDTSRLFVPQKGFGTNHQLAEWDRVKLSKPGMLILTPSMGEGVDLLNERICIVAKVPFPSIAPGSYDYERMVYSNSMYKLRTAWSLEQRCGRTRRGRPEDYDIGGKVNGYVAIVDGSFQKMGIKKYCSSDFTGALVD